MASATPKPDMVARARAAAESPNVTITEEDLMEEGWLKVYSERYIELHPEDCRCPSQPASVIIDSRPGTGEEPLAEELEPLADEAYHWHVFKELAD